MIDPKEENDGIRYCRGLEYRFITEQVPYEYKKTLTGLEGIIKYMSSIIADDAKETKEKMQALTMKMELVSSANLVEEAIDLVESYRGYTTEKRKVMIDGTAGST
ncbi:MAG: hypothetical protein GEU26_19190 [Nitrososphaeraceae archaeon]|nr:hypothetical protein [Nitrososphaeraceae archaeon]